MKQFTGTVVSTKMNNTVVVMVPHVWVHPMYKKSLKRDRKFAAHNTIKDITVGDTVKIEEIRPMSKSKHFKVIEKLT